MHRNVEYFHPRLPYQLRVGPQVFLGHRFVLEEKLKGVGESDAVHLKFVPDVHSNVPQRSELKTIDAVPTHVCPRPVPARQLDPLALVIDYLDALGGEGEGDVLYVEEGSFGVEVDFVVFEFVHEIPVPAKIGCVAHYYDNINCNYNTVVQLIPAQLTST